MNRACDLPLLIDDTTFNQWVDSGYKPESTGDKKNIRNVIDAFIKRSKLNQIVAL